VISIQVFDAVGANYTITNNGTLVADGGNDGIDTIDQVDARPNITVINTGTISGVHAIRANNMLDLTNSGTLTGTGIASASVFAKNGGTIVNTGTGSIVGLVHGIQSENASGTLNVTNSNDIIGQNFT